MFEKCWFRENYPYTQNKILEKSENYHFDTWGRILFGQSHIIKILSHTSADKYQKPSVLNVLYNFEDQFRKLFISVLKRSHFRRRNLPKLVFFITFSTQQIYLFFLHSKWDLNKSTGSVLYFPKNLNKKIYGSVMATVWRAKQRWYLRFLYLGMTLD